MPEEYYKPNSFKSKEEQERKKNTPVATGRKREKSELEKAASSFFSEDFRTVKNSVIEDVIIPRIKKLITESIKSRVDILFYGKSTPAPSGSSLASRIRYNTVSKNKSYSNEPQRAVYDYGEVIVDSEQKRRDIVKQVNDVIFEYGSRRVADLYEFADIPTEHTDFKYGWYNIQGYSISKYGYGSDSGWIIKMPRVVPLPN